MDERLTLISTMVQPCETVADVGCDHGYLVCALVRQGKCRQGIAADINPMPLEKARQEVASQGLQQQVRCVCTDGLQGIGRQDAVIVAGMGGELIAEILEQWEHRTDPHIRYYLQPMTKAERLRAWLYENGCRIVREQCCIAAGRPASWPGLHRAAKRRRACNTGRHCSKSLTCGWVLEERQSMLSYKNTTQRHTALSRVLSCSLLSRGNTSGGLRRCRLAGPCRTGSRFRAVLR